MTEITSVCLTETKLKVSKRRGLTWNIIHSCGQISSLNFVFYDLRWQKSPSCSLVHNTLFINDFGKTYDSFSLETIKSVHVSFFADKQLAKKYQLSTLCILNCNHIVLSSCRRLQLRQNYNWTWNHRFKQPIFKSSTLQNMTRTGLGFVWKSVQ